MRNIELAKLTADETRIMKDNELELAKLTYQEKVSRLQIEQETDKEIKLARLKLEHEKLKMEQEVELSRIDSLERQAKQDSETKFASKLELGIFGIEKAVHRPNPKLPYFEESKDKMDSYLSRFKTYMVANKWNSSICAAYLSALLKGQA